MNIYSVIVTIDVAIMAVAALSNLSKIAQSAQVHLIR